MLLALPALSVIIHAETMPFFSVGATPDLTNSVVPSEVVLDGSMNSVALPVRVMPFVNVTVSPLVPPVRASNAVAPTLNDPNVTAPAVLVLLLVTVSVRWTSVIVPENEVVNPAVS